jgi:hypothetical protein
VRCRRGQDRRRHCQQRGEPADCAMHIDTRSSGGAAGSRRLPALQGAARRALGFCRDVANVDLDADCDRRVRRDRDGRGDHEARLI